ncbi:MAG: hypothetical protein L0Z48_04220 [candidate division Zixibacteria bacterium]|nr:hypothetical protein [candidate division Zixibacteria bacterium]
MVCKPFWGFQNSKIKEKIKKLAGDLQDVCPVAWLRNDIVDRRVQISLLEGNSAEEDLTVAQAMGGCRTIGCTSDLD